MYKRQAPTLVATAAAAAATSVGAAGTGTGTAPGWAWAWAMRAGEEARCKPSHLLDPKVKGRRAGQR